MPNQPAMEIVTGRESLDQIIQTTFAVVSAIGQEDYGLLDRLVDSHNYRSAFVQHARQLAPDGALVGTVEVTRQGLGSVERAVLTPASRQSISQYIVADSPPVAVEDKARTAVVSGTLRALDLDKKTIRVEIRGGQSQLCMIDRAIILDDVVGPMVNRLVRVPGYRQDRGGTVNFVLTDIQLVESEQDALPL